MHACMYVSTQVPMTSYYVSVNCLFTRKGQLYYCFYFHGLWPVPRMQEPDKKPYRWRIKIWISELRDIYSKLNKCMGPYNRFINNMSSASRV